MNFLLDNPSKYLYLLIIVYFFFIPRFCDMDNTEKNKFFNILSKSQLISVFFLLIIASINFDNHSNLINLSYIYCIITANIVVAIIVFYLKLDDIIKNTFEKYIGKEFVHKILVILYSVILFIYLFFPKFDFISNYAPTILTILLSLNFLSIKYTNKKKVS